MTIDLRAWCAALLLAVALPAAAQPSGKTIRFIAPYTPGGVVDNTSRVVAERMSRELGQPIVIENRAGAQGILGIGAVKQAAPDGYTIGYANLSNLVINKFMYAKLPYDAPDDFEMVSQIGLASLGMAVPASMGVKNVDEFVRWVRARPGKTTFASFGSGSSSHLYGEMLKGAAKLDIVHVPYKGASAAVTDLLAGRIHLMIDVVQTPLPHIQGGKLKALGTTGAQRIALLPDVPTIAEQGLPGFQFTTWIGLAAPAGTPPAIVNRLHAEMAKALAMPEVKEAFAKQGMEVAPSASPEAYAQHIRGEQERLANVIRGAGIQPE